MVKIVKSLLLTEIAKPQLLPSWKQWPYYAEKLLCAYAMESNENNLDALTLNSMSKMLGR